MAGSDSDEENPYAPPKSRLDGPAGEPVEEPSDDDRDFFVIDPWLPARDVIDRLLGAVILLLFGGPIFGAISALFYWVLEMPGIVVGIWVVLSVGISHAFFVLFPNMPAPWTVSHLTIDTSGIAFRRLVGKPKFLPWQNIQTIRPATRAEVFVHAWLKPLSFREPTLTRSARGHYGIEWAGGYVFFPPRDPQQFVRAVRRFRPDLASEFPAN